MYFKRAHKNSYLKANRQASSIKYIVVHYTANDRDTARNNLDYYARAGVPASAHYYVDDTEVCCSVPWDDVAYHCGAKKYIHQECRNTNSIGVEMCSRSNDGKATFNGYYFTIEVRARTISFVAQLMRDYNIPIDRVIRHRDVTGKTCPAPFVTKPEEWIKFKHDLMEQIKKEEVEKMDQETFNKMYAIAKQLDEKITEIEPVSAWAKEAWQEALEMGLVDATRPLSSITRQEVATIAIRLFNLLV